MTVLHHISSYVILAQLVAVAFSFMGKYLYKMGSNIASFVLFMSLTVLTIMFVAFECDLIPKWKVTLFKFCVLCTLLFRFWKALKFSAKHFSLAFSVMLLYVLFVDLNTTYSCDVKEQTLLITIGIGTMMYLILSRVHAYSMKKKIYS